MKKLLIAVVASSTFVFSTAFADQGFTVGAAVGSAKTELEDLGLGVNFDATDFSWRIFGNYMLTENFGVEAGYVELGAPEDNVQGIPIEIDTSGFNAYLVGSIPVSDTFDLFAKAGVISWDTEISTDGFSISDDGSDLAYGVGAAFNVTDSLSFRGEWESFDISDTDALWMLSVGITIGF